MGVRAVARRPRGSAATSSSTGADERGHLRGGGADEGERVGEQWRRASARSRRRRSSAASRSSRSLPPAPFSRRAERGGHGVLLDDLVRLLPADAGPDRGHEHLGRGQERAGTRASSPLDHGREGAEAVEHGEEASGSRPSAAKKASGRATRRTTESDDVALVPLVAGDAGDHGQVARRARRARPLIRSHGAGVHLVGHGRGARPGRRRSPRWPARGRP